MPNSSFPYVDDLNFLQAISAKCDSEKNSFNLMLSNTIKRQVTGLECLEFHCCPQANAGARELRDGKEMSSAV